VGAGVAASYQTPLAGPARKVAAGNRPPYDPTCYLCPGNDRAGTAKNPNYDSTFVFTNDFAALLPETPQTFLAPHPLLQAESEQGTSRVICFSPRHDLTLPEMTVEAIRGVIDVWAEQVTELGRQYRWVQLFENKGAIMGCSNPHPHGQIWAGSALPNEPAKEENQQWLHCFAEVLLGFVLRGLNFPAIKLPPPAPAWPSLSNCWTTATACRSLASAPACTN
jgi:UDPglucose--hexose-1-phosphate uridylyltransferase